MKNYSRQREAILTALRSTDSHPTANRVYEKVRETIPNISLGTVYRNLSALCENGDIISLTVGDGFEHFDGNNNPHLHLHCKVCGNITDICLDHDMFSDEALKKGFIPETSVYLIQGICSECKKQQN